MKFLLGFLCGAALWAAGPSGPVAGYALDSRTATLRAIAGLPGALRLADPVVLPFGVAAAEFAPSGDSALVLTNQQPAHLILVTALASSPTFEDMGEVPDGSRILALNRKGNSAILYSPATQTVRFATALGTAPSLSAPVATPSPVAAGLLEDSGQCAVLANTTIDTLCADGTTRRVLESAGLQVAALAFSNNGQDLWVADNGGQQISCVSAYAQHSAAAIFASASDGISNPVALAVAPNGQVIVADSGGDSGTPALFVIDPSGSQPVQTVPLNVTPSQLRPLTDRTLLLVNDLSALPFTLLSSSEMRTYFVPAN